MTDTTRREARYRATPSRTTNAARNRVTHEEIAKFEAVLAQADEQGKKLHPILARAQREALQSQLDELQEQVRAYESGHRGHAPDGHPSDREPLPQSPSFPKGRTA